MLPELTCYFQTWTQSLANWYAVDSIATLPWEEQVTRVAKFLEESQESTTSPNGISLFGTDELRLAAALNFLTTFSVKRKNGQPYTPHPMLVGWLLREFAEADDQQIAAALIHDLFEEDVIRVAAANKKRKPGEPLQVAFLPHDEKKRLVPNLISLREEINGQIPGYFLGDVALELTEPSVVVAGENPLFKHARFVYWATWCAQKKPWYINVKIADKLHDVLDLGYLLDNSDLTHPQRQQKLGEKFGKLFFTFEHLTHDRQGDLRQGVSPRLVSLFQQIFWHQIDLHLNKEGKQHFWKTFKSLTSELITNSDTYHQQVTAYAIEVGLQADGQAERFA